MHKTMPIGVKYKFSLRINQSLLYKKHDMTKSKNGTERFRL